MSKQVADLAMKWCDLKCCDGVTLRWREVICSDCVCEPAYGETWEQLVEVLEKILAPDGSVLISLRRGFPPNPYGYSESCGKAVRVWGWCCSSCQHRAVFCLKSLALCFVKTHTCASQGTEKIEWHVVPHDDNVLLVLMMVMLVLILMLMWNDAWVMLIFRRRSHDGIENFVMRLGRKLRFQRYRYRKSDPANADGVDLTLGQVSNKTLRAPQKEFLMISLISLSFDLTHLDSLLLSFWI